MKMCKKQKPRTSTSNRFKSQEVLAEEHYALPCTNGTSRRPSIAERKLDREDDVEIEENDKKKKPQPKIRGLCVDHSVVDIMKNSA